MPKLDLRNALRIKAQGGELSALKGAGFAWARSFDDFSPLDLFTAGEQGYWLDPSDFSTMFQDTAGTTPVTAVGQTVARINDKSGRGNHFTQSSASLRPLLQVDGSGKYYLDFDGVDDEMGSASITPGTNKVQVFAGVRKTSDAVIGAITGNRTAINTPDGFFEMLAPAGAGINNFGFHYKGTGTRRELFAGGYAAPFLAVLHAFADITAPVASLRVNNDDPIQNTVETGSGDFAVGVHKLGRRGATAVRYNGRIYQLIVRFGPNLTSFPVAAARQFCANKAGVSL
jgi:hypothetical protein